MKKYLIGILFVFWIIFIFLSSGESITTSNHQSIMLLTRIVQTLPISFSSSSIEKIVLFFNLPFRKLAHFGVFCILSILGYSSFRFFGFSKKSALFVFLFCVFYAIFDEAHQLFVVGRSCRIIDCCIDMLGSLFGCMMLDYYNILKKVSRN